MADYKVHISQARHNEETAIKLVQEPHHHDWGITATFYAAIHYFEYWLCINKIGKEQHTETSIRIISDKGKPSLHNWRAILVRKNVPTAYRNYRYLRNSSQIARYLTIPGSASQWISVSAPEYFSLEKVKSMIANDLAILKKELRI